MYTAKPVWPSYIKFMEANQAEGAMSLRDLNDGEQLPACLPARLPACLPAATTTGQHTTEQDGAGREGAAAAL